jgi:MFS family permease
LAILAASAPYGLFVAFNFKEYGFLYLTDDHFLSLLGSLGSVTNGVFRMLLGIFMDYIPFKMIMLFNLGVFIVSCATIVFSVKLSATYLITVVLTYGCYGSLYSIFPTQTVRILGRQIGPKVYYLTFIGFSFGGIIQYVFHKFLVDEYK